jgi:hypothetical protein
LGISFTKTPFLHSQRIPQVKLESFDEYSLGLVELYPGRVWREPPDPVDLRVGAVTQYEVARIQGIWIEVGFDCPCDDGLS